MNLFFRMMVLVAMVGLFSTDGIAQDKAEAKPPKLEDELFNRDVLYPEPLTLRADGVPVFVAKANDVEISVAAFRGGTFIYFQLEYVNSSASPHAFSALDFSLIDDRGFKVRPVDINYVRDILYGDANAPTPPPPPAPQVSTTTVNTTTTGTVDQFGNINAQTSGQATTRTGPDPFYQTGYALGTLIGGLMTRGARKAEAALLEDISAYGFNYLTIGPNERQRVYIAYSKVESKSFTLQLPAHFGQTVKLLWKKPKK